jgi:antitoxin ParD1/3/4
MQTGKAERITITLPPEMLATTKNKVKSGAYGSTSELIREAMRLWQKKEEEHQARLSLIRDRLTNSVQSGEPVPLDDAFKTIERFHQHRMKTKSDEKNMMSI